MKKLMLVGVALALLGCGENRSTPQIFLPRVVGPEGADLETLRARYCQGTGIDLNDILTPENFRAIFNCANYDSSLESLRPLLTSQEFPSFLKNINLILSSENTGDLKETLRAWLEQGAGGTSRLDRLLPLLAKIIKNPSFQAGLPLVNQLLEAGGEVWEELLPGLADLVHQERFPDTFDDITELLSDPSRDQSRDDYGALAKDWATFLQAKVRGKSISLRALELAYRTKEIEIRGTHLREYLDHLNEKGVFVSLYLDNGAVRGEVLDPKLNADPDEEELKEGLNLTPEQRRERAYRKLFAPGPGGQDPPIVQLAGLVEVFHRDHPEFFSALANWLSANGPRVAGGLTEFVVRGQALANLSQLSVDRFLNSYAREIGLSPQAKVTAPEFVAFLEGAFASPAFSVWIETEQNSLNSTQFGARNGELMKASGLSMSTLSLYRIPAVAQFGATLIPADRPQLLSAAMKRFSSLHRTEKLTLEFAGVNQSLEGHLVDLWWGAAKTTLGEGVVVDFTMRLVQSFFLEFAAEFPRKNLSLAEWYFGSPYGNPGTTEMIAGYAVKELDLLPKYRKNKKWLQGEFADEIFTVEADKEAFRLLVEQVPNLWLYLRSGMSRDGNDLVRAMASKDRGYLIRGYVDIIASAQRSGWIKDAVALVHAYHQKFEPSSSAGEVSDELEERRRVSKGADALKRLLRALFEPEEKGNYQTSTLGRLLNPISSLVSPERRGQTESFVAASAAEVLKLPDEDINNFMRELLSSSPSEGATADRRETLRAAAEFLRDPISPTVVRQLSLLFRENAVKPALDFLAQKVDDGTLPEVLLFLRRILGFRG
jgi:hypothetical protein